MSIWFLDAVLVTISIGSIAFINKVSAERKYNQMFSTSILYGILCVFSWIYLIFCKSSLISGWEIGLVMFWGVLSCLYSIIMMTALRHLPTSTYFVGVRLLSSFIILLVGIIFFNESLSFYEVTGFILGIISITLLFEKEGKFSINYSKGTLMLFLGVLNLSTTHAITKFLSLDSEKTPMVLAVLFTTSFLFSLLLSFNIICKNKKYFFPIFKINFIQAVFYFFGMVMLMDVYRNGSLVISYKIQSYSPFIPIILSAFIYKEKISTKKKIALILVAVSLWFFH